MGKKKGELRMRGQPLLLVSIYSMFTDPRRLDMYTFDLYKHCDAGSIF